MNNHWLNKKEEIRAEIKKELEKEYSNKLAMMQEYFEECLLAGYEECYKIVQELQAEIKMLKEGGYL